MKLSQTRQPELLDDVMVLLRLLLFRCIADGLTIGLKKTEQDLDQVAGAFRAKSERDGLGSGL